MPRLWSATLEDHRQSVRDAALDATATLVARHGLRGVTMSQIAVETGIGRATLYKYFPDLDAVLVAWHERTVSGHLREILGILCSDGPALGRLERALSAFARMDHQGGEAEISAMLHAREHVGHAARHLDEGLCRLLREGQEDGSVRCDVPAQELAAFCRHALHGVGAEGPLGTRIRLVLDAVTSVG